MDKHNIEGQKKGSFVTAKCHLNGRMSVAPKHDNPSKFKHKTPREQQKERSTQGKKGITKNDRQNLENALFWLKNKYGIESIRWMVIPYHLETNTEQIENIYHFFLILIRNTNKLKFCIMEYILINLTL